MGRDPSVSVRPRATSRPRSRHASSWRGVGCLSTGRASRGASWGMGGASCHRRRVSGALSRRYACQSAGLWQQPITRKAGYASVCPGRGGTVRRAGATRAQRMLPAWQPAAVRPRWPWPVCDRAASSSRRRPWRVWPGPSAGATGSRRYVRTCLPSPGPCPCMPLATRPARYAIPSAPASAARSQLRRARWRCGCGGGGCTSPGQSLEQGPGIMAWPLCCSVCACVEMPRSGAARTACPCTRQIACLLLSGSPLDGGRVRVQTGSGDGGGTDQRFLCAMPAVVLEPDVVSGNAEHDDLECNLKKIVFVLKVTKKMPETRTRAYFGAGTRAP